MKKLFFVLVALISLSVSAVGNDTATYDTGDGYNIELMELPSIAVANDNVMIDATIEAGNFVAVTFTYVKSDLNLAIEKAKIEPGYLLEKEPDIYRKPIKIYDYNSICSNYEYTEGLKEPAVYSFRS